MGTRIISSARLALIGAAAALAGGLLAPVAHADQVDYTLFAGNDALAGCCSGPYATVNVNRDSTTTATITFTGLVNDGYQYLLGGQGAAAVNVNASSWDIDTFMGSNGLAGFTGANSDLSDDGSNQEDGWGVFNQTVDNFDGFSHAWQVISFVLTNTGGTWANAASVLVGNAGGYQAAAHIFACATSSSTPCSQSTGATVTGYASVPIPPALGLLLSGLAGLGFLGRRRRRANQAPAEA